MFLVQDNRRDKSVRSGLVYGKGVNPIFYYFRDIYVFFPFFRLILIYHVTYDRFSFCVAKIESISVFMFMWWQKVNFCKWTTSFLWHMNR